MPFLEYSHRKVFTSTGAGEWADAYTAYEHTFIAETNAGSSATIVFEHRMKGGTSVIPLSSANLSASTAAQALFTGVYYQTRPRVTDMTGTVTVAWFGA